MKIINYQHFFYKRIFVLIVFKICTLLIVIFKLSVLQVFLRKKYQRLSNLNAKRTNYTFPARGDILDKNKVSFTKNDVSYNLTFYKTNKNYLEIIKKAYKITGREVKHSTLETLDKKIKKNPKHIFLLLKRLTLSEIRRIKFYQFMLPGIDVSEVKVRNYNLPNVAHVIGYVAKMTGTQIKKNINIDKNLLENLNYKIGQYGLEKTFNEQLQEKPNIFEININAFGDKVEENLIEKGQKGKDIITTLDYEIQALLKDKFTEFGACSIIDLRTGGIIGMQSNPCFDASKLSIGFDEDEDFFNKKDAEFIDKNISFEFPPASPYKIVAGLAALIYGDLDPEEKFVDCTGSYKVDNRIFKCWLETGHGKVNFYEALGRSCNCYFLKLIAKGKLNITDITDIAYKLGFGKQTGIELASERKGFLPTKEWKKKLYKYSWFNGDTANISLGHGFLTATNIQLLKMISSIATGMEVHPRLVNTLPVKDKIDIDEKYLKIARRALEETAISGSIKNFANPKYKIIGKTGTSQVISRSFSRSEIASGSVKKKERSNGIFVGYAPFDKPAFAISTLVEHGTWGAISAAPVSIKILEHLVKRENLF